MKNYVVTRPVHGEQSVFITAPSKRGAMNQVNFGKGDVIGCNIYRTSRANAAVEVKKMPRKRKNIK